MNTRRLLLWSILGTIIALIATHLFWLGKQPLSVDESAALPQSGPHRITASEHQEQTDAEPVEVVDEDQRADLAAAQEPASRGPDQVTPLDPMPSLGEVKAGVVGSAPQILSTQVDGHWTPYGVDTRSRAPLMLTRDDIDPDVRYFGDATGANLYLRLPTKTSEEIEAISEQPGDILYDGQLVKRGPSPGARLQSGGTNIGLAFYYPTLQEAEATAKLLGTTWRKKGK